MFGYKIIKEELLGALKSVSYWKGRADEKTIVILDGKTKPFIVQHTGRITRKVSTYRQALELKKAMDKKFKTKQKAMIFKRII